MCSRFTTMMPKWRDVWHFLRFDPPPDFEPEDYHPQFNIAPLDPVWIVHTGEPKQRFLFSNARWGLIPKWAKDRKFASKTINARAETLREKPSFRDAFNRGRRCVIPASGFYEWTGEKGKRKPLLFHREDKQVLLFAGLYEDWTDRETGEERRTFTIVTKDSSGPVEPIHDRMPVMLDADAVDAWLTEKADRLSATELPTIEDALTWYRVSPRMNSPKADGPECVEPISE